MELSGVGSIGKNVARDKMQIVELAIFLLLLAIWSSLLRDLSPFFGLVATHVYGWKAIFFFLSIYSISVLFCNILALLSELHSRKT